MPCRCRVLFCKIQARLLSWRHYLSWRPWIGFNRVERKWRSPCKLNILSHCRTLVLRCYGRNLSNGLGFSKKIECRLRKVLIPWCTAKLVLWLLFEPFGPWIAVTCPVIKVGKHCWLLSAPRSLVAVQTFSSVSERSFSRSTKFQYSKNPFENEYKILRWDHLVISSFLTHLFPIMPCKFCPSVSLSTNHNKAQQSTLSRCAVIGWNI